ncbi:MAG: glycoside hydrolase family 3 N-terminal domain-containing protein [Aggregatilineales bacterium]
MKRYHFFLTVVLNVALLLLISVGLSAQDDPDVLPYLNPDLSVEERVEDLLSRMSLEEKIGQMTLIEKNSITPEQLTEYFVGAILSGGGGYPRPNTAESWYEMVSGFQDAALATPLQIPMLYGVDAVHGHNNVRNAVIFPHNVGLGATRNPELVEQIGRITALEMIGTGIYWDYAPVLAVPQDIRWGRTYEGYGEQTDLVTELAMAFMRGLQGDDLADPHNALATPKHFVGDGGAVWGTSPFGSSNIDRGVTDVDEETLRAIHLPPYLDAIENGARSIMISYSSWGGLNMHAQDYLIQDVLRGELGFDGFIVSDWEAINVISPDYYTSVVVSTNAGIDMNMVPYDYETFISALTEAVENGDVTMERIDEAVSNILRVKFEIGLFEHPYGDEALLETIGSDEHRAVAREAVAQSLVLLKNEEATLPISSDAGMIFIAGEGADDIGIQNGGWTIEWQGTTGTNSTAGTTIVEAFEDAVDGDTRVVYNRAGRFDVVTDDDGNPIIADVGVVVIGERPYAEWFGDDLLLNIPRVDNTMLERVAAQSERLVVIVLSGRPIVITDQLLQADAVVAAWLPGTEGAGITDVLFGDRDFTGTLSYTWLRGVDQLPFDFANLPETDCEAPLFPYGYGLTYENSESPYLDLAIECAPDEEEAAVIPEDSDFIAPVGTFGENYYAPVPVSITLDGEFEDWAGVPTVTLPQSNDPASGAPSVTFAAASDGEFLYLWGDVVDSNIISGEHGADYWNEDSVEFYVNGTGNPDLTSYQEGVAQITIPPLNAGMPMEDAIIGGVQGETAEAQIITVLTDTGYAVEVAIPLENAVWSIDSASEDPIGFQVHLNIASSGGRDSKLIWSLWDTADQSYQNPSLFGELYFYPVGDEASTEEEASTETTTEATEEEVSTDETDDITWDSREWTLVWSDEFDAPAGTPINDEFWTCEEGGHGWGNGELQYYNQSLDNVSQDGEGNLSIVAREENPEDYTCHYGTCTHTSARCITEGKVEFTYGRVEARIQVPFGQGIWPAFWMLGANFRRAGWPSAGEIDIMEHIGREPYAVYGTVHGPLYSGGNGIGDGTTLAEPVTDDFHVFAVDWDENELRWYVDGELYFTLTADDLPANRTWVFDHDFFMLLNVAVGGGWPGYPDDTTEFPQTMLVDYVRVYELAE